MENSRYDILGAGKKVLDQANRNPNGIEMTTMDGPDRGEVEDMVRKQLRDRSPTSNNVSEFKFYNFLQDKNSAKSGSFFGKSQKTNVGPSQLAPVNMLA